MVQGYCYALRIVTEPVTERLHGDGHIGGIALRLGAELAIRAVLMFLQRCSMDYPVPSVVVFAANVGS